jgi:bloom syndrome protein
MAEAFDDARVEDQPLQPASRNNVAPLRSRQPAPVEDEDYMAAMAEFDDLPEDAFLSSPTTTTSRPIRAEASVPRSNMGGPGPSTQQAQLARAQAIRGVAAPVKPVTTHRWSKEVNKKLRDVFRLPGFRHHQKEAIDATMGGRDGMYT